MHLIYFINIIFVTSNNFYMTFVLRKIVNNFMKYVIFKFFSSQLIFCNKLLDDSMMLIVFNFFFIKIIIVYKYSSCIYTFNINIKITLKVGHMSFAKSIFPIA